MRTLKSCFPLLLSLLLLMSGCGEKKEQAPAANGTGPQGSAVKKESVIVVPDSVKGKWKAVKVSVLDKDTHQETVLTIPIGQEVRIPGSTVSIVVEAFLPHFIIDGTALTSQSNDPKNPAAHIRILENGKEIHKGWLFSLYPTTHAFQHPKYGFTLVDFIPAS